MYVCEHAELTEKNRAIMGEVVQALFVEHDPVKFGSFVSDEGYIQHNPDIPDGKEAIVEYLSRLFKGIGHLVATAHRIVVDGDIALTHSTFKSRDGSPGGFVLMDVFRLRDGKLVEHWDVSQPFPTEAANAHPMV